MSGYKSCACRDCFEVAIGNDDGPALCWECEEYDCDATGDSECNRPDAYDSGELDHLESD